MSQNQDGILADITEMLRAILFDYGTDIEITRQTSFHEDLDMESIDLVALAGRLQARYGNSVNFAQFIAGLDLESIIELRVGQLVDFVARSLDTTNVGVK